MVTIHDINDQANEDYYDPENNQFKNIMKFAENYIATYNEKKLAKNTPEKTKILYLTSFLWHNNIFASGKQLAKYLDIHYRNSKLIIYADRYGCDLANLASEQLGYLKEINESIRGANEEVADDDEKKLYKGRIKLLLYFSPISRHKIPKELKSLFINPIGMVYDALNDSFSTQPTNYNLLLVLHSPSDEEERKAFNNEMEAVTKIIIGFGGLVTYVAVEKIKEEGISARAILMGTAGGMTISYALWSKHNQVEKMIDALSHQYEKIKLENKFADDSFVIEGPKVYLKTIVNGECIEHNNQALAENLFVIYTILKKQYASELARGRSFCVNINTNHDIQDLLEHLHENEDIFNDNTIKSKIKNEFKFWNNKENNCKVQCWFDDDYKVKAIEPKNSSYFHQVRMKEKLRQNPKVLIDSTELELQAEGTSISHQRLYEYIKTVQ